MVLQNQNKADPTDVMLNRMATFAAQKSTVPQIQTKISHKLSRKKKNFSDNLLE